MTGGASPAPPCAACGKGNIRHQCKVCKTWLYCSRGCAKNDSKKHKKMCSKFALAEQSNAYGHLSVEECKILSNHKMACIVMSVGGGGAGVERQTGNGAGAALDAGAKVSDAVFAKTAVAKIKQSREEVENLRSLRAAAVANVKVVNASLAASLRGVQGKAAEAMRYGDPLYWEERYAKDRLGGKTHEWYVDYPSTAFQQAFPSSVRDKRFLVLGCGNSELSEQMCLDRFRDVVSIDVSESAVAQMAERAPQFNSADSKCRYEVMDATQLAFDAGTFGGVVDKGTLDATLSGGKETARRICAEAMRVLEPGGKFLIVSNSGGDVLLGPLLEMCGPGAECDEPVAVSSSPVVYAYAVRKGMPCVGEALDDRQAQPPQLPPPRARSRAAEAPSSAMVPDDVQREVAVGQASRGGAKPPATATASPGVACFETDARVGSPSPASNAVGSNSLGGRKKNWTSLSGRAPAAGGDQEGGGVDERLGALRARLLGHCESLVEQGRRRGWDKARGPSSGGSGGGGGGSGGGAMSLPQNTSVGDEYIREEGVRPRERFPGKQQGNEHRLAKEEEALLAKITSSVEASRKATGETDMRKGSASSLPWGVTEVSNNEDEFFANFELDLTTEIKKSELSVEIKATHVTVSRGPSGARDVLFDRELADKVDATESTWVIEDKTVLSVSLCKKIPGEWGRLFKDDVPPPVASSEIKGKEEIASCPSRSNGEETLLAAPTSDPVAAAPLAAPRTRKASPKSAIMACRNFVPPERFLVEDQAGIKTLQLHISKPPGLKVAECKVSRVGPEVCEVRLVCLDEARIDGPSVFFLQSSELGRKSFDPDRATLSGDDAASGVCVVRVPYDVGSLTGKFGCVELEDGSGPGTGDDDDADNENVSRVARLRCRFCDHPFTPPGKGLSVRALPSGRWDECIEDMICYDGPSAVPMLARDVSYAHAGRCLMKKSAVLVHPHDVVPGSVAAVADDGNPERGGSTDADVIEGANDRHDLEWRSLKCARCEFPLGRLAPSLEGQTDERRGLMLLKHCLLGDDVSEPEDARDVGDGRCSNLGVERNRQKRVGQEAVSGGGGGGRQRRRGALVTTPVFEGRTVIKWLMAEMEDSKHADNCSRFILAVRERSWAAPDGCLSLILIALHTRVSEDGSRKPQRAHRIAFREQSRDEAETADAMEHGDGGEGTPESKEGERGSGGRREARVPARVLELSCGEYRAVRQRLVEAAWASTLTVYGDFTTSDSRGYSLSYLF